MKTKEFKIIATDEDIDIFMDFFLRGLISYRFSNFFGIDYMNLGLEVDKKISKQLIEQLDDIKEIP